MSSHTLAGMLRRFPLPVPVPVPVPARVLFHRNASQLHPVSVVDGTLKALCASGRLLPAVELLCCTNASCVTPQTYALLLQETIHRKEARLGRRIHSRMITEGFAPDGYLTTKLLVFYAKHGDLDSAHKIFDRIPHRGILVPWNAMISGYVHKGLEQEALDLYCSMRSAGLRPDHFTFASVFRACAKLATLDHGKRAHCIMIKTQVRANVVVNSALIDMYFKCSSSGDGHRVFSCSSSSMRNVVTWTALISGYGQHGRVAEVLELFHDMTEQGFRPNSITFLALLSACSHGGLVDDGWKYFSSMSRDYGIKPKGEHCAAMVDLLGRAGRLNEAYEFIKRSPFGEHCAIWGALLGACRVHGDPELVRLAANNFFQMQPENAGKYIVLSNTFAASDMWDSVADVRGTITTLGIKKDPAWSSIQVRGQVHTFLVADKSHEQSEEIYETIKTLGSAVMEAGLVPNKICKALAKN